jgi:chromosome segregation ATPase
VDYTYGSTPSVAGRLGFSFPLGKINKNKKPVVDGSSTDLSIVNNNITKLQDEVKTRDQQIETLRVSLDKLVSSQSSDISKNQQGAEATKQLIASLKARIDELEQEKRNSEKEDSNQNALIRALQEKLSSQEAMFQRMMQQLKTLTSAVKSEKPR